MLCSIPFGTNNVVIMQDRGITIREAQLSDMLLYFKWANDPVVRQMAFHSEPISWESHCKWFEGKLRSAKSHLTVCYSGKNPVGQVRFDEIAEGEYEIDISVDSELRNKGRGRKMLQSALDFVYNKYGINCFFAAVKADNLPSQRMFAAAGFELQKVENHVNYYRLLIKE